MPHTYTLEEKLSRCATDSRDAPLPSHLLIPFAYESAIREVNVRSRPKKVPQTSRAREGEEVERDRRQQRFVRIVSANGARSERLGVGETCSSHMPVRGQFAAASAAGSGSVRASVTQNSRRHGGAQEKQEAKRCKDRIWAG